MRRRSFEMVDRYGNRRVPKMLGEVNSLRKAIAREGTENIQRAWDKVEQHIDFAYGVVGKCDNKEGKKDEPAPP